MLGTTNAKVREIDKIISSFIADLNLNEAKHILCWGDEQVWDSLNHWKGQLRITRCLGDWHVKKNVINAVIELYNDFCLKDLLLLIGFEQDLSKAPVKVQEEQLRIIYFALVQSLSVFFKSRGNCLRTTRELLLWASSHLTDPIPKCWWRLLLITGNVYLLSSAIRSGNGRLLDLCYLNILPLLVVTHHTNYVRVLLERRKEMVQMEEWEQQAIQTSRFIKYDKNSKHFVAVDEEIELENRLIKDLLHGRSNLVHIEDVTATFDWGHRVVHSALDVFPPNTEHITPSIFKEVNTLSTWMQQKCVWAANFNVCNHAPLDESICGSWYEKGMAFLNSILEQRFLSVQPTNYHYGVYRHKLNLLRASSSKVTN